MVVIHKKTGDLYQLLDDKCKAKINGKWVDAVCYRTIDDEGNWQWYVREKTDFENHFTPCGGINTNENYPSISDKIYILEKVAEEYPGKTIENIIAQLEARRNELNKSK